MSALDELPGDWQALSGISGSGWDIRIGYSVTEHPGRRYAIWWRRIERPSRPFKKGKIHPTEQSAGMVISELRDHGFDETLFMDVETDLYAKDPTYGAF